MSVYAMMADGLEEVECLSVVDVLRRAGIETVMVSIGETRQVTGSHHISVMTDAVWSEITVDAEDTIFLPGGMPGTKNLAQYAPLADLLKAHAAAGGRIAAICAAPSVLGDLGLLAGKNATCYPGWEEHLFGACVCKDGVVKDGTVLTARGLGYGLDLGLAMVAEEQGAEAAAKLKAAIQYDR